MYKIDKHPILEVPQKEEDSFTFHNEKVKAEKGYTIAAALHQAGYPVHSHSVKHRERSLECGIGKCGACEMLVDGEVRRICITKVDGVNRVEELPSDYQPRITNYRSEKQYKVYKTDVAVIGAGPAGLAAREVLNEYGIPNVVVDNNNRIGGQFVMQTHQFFFFEQQKKFGGQRGFDIAGQLAGDDRQGIFLNSTVWDILDGKRLAIKNIATDEIYFVDADYLVVATGAIPFLPPFENDDLPGVYTAAVVQKMMNTEFTLLGKNVLSIGAGNIGYLTSYQLTQAGANVKAIIEAQPSEGGFPVQANRVRRLGIPIMTGHTLLKAIPNKNHDGINGVIIAECRDFKPIPGTEKLIDGIDAINVCTGLIADDQLMIKGNEVFGRKCHVAGDALRIGEGTTAVLRGKQAAYEVLQQMDHPINHKQYLKLSKEYIDSQQEPEKVLEKPYIPSHERMWEKPFVIIDCLHGFACNPCAFACPYGAITKSSASTAPHMDFKKCTGCMQCIHQCPGLAVFGYDLKKQRLFFPVEFDVKANKEVFLIDNLGKKLGEGMLEKVLHKPNMTHVARIKALDLGKAELIGVRGFIAKENYPEPLELKPADRIENEESFVCHCEDVKLKEILEIIGDRNFISVDEIKHITRMGMGACRGKRCVKRLKQMLGPKGVTLVGDSTPRAPLSNQIGMGEIYPPTQHEKVLPLHLNGGLKKIKTKALVAGGGIGGSALFRYLAEEGYSPVLVNYERGSSWRNIAGGRPNFSMPELSEIALKNKEIFEDLQQRKNIDYRPIRYVTMAHDDKVYAALEESMKWSDSYMIKPADFPKEIAPTFNPNCQKYKAALVTKNCWQSTPGKTIDLLRKIGIENGGAVQEDCKMIDVWREKENYHVLVRQHDGEYVVYITENFINALGHKGEEFAKKLGIDTKLFPVKHQAFITRRLPYLGIDGKPFPMVIDRRKYKGFVAVYGQQLAETGQIIGCASPENEPLETQSNLKINSKEFMEIATEVFVDWLPELSSIGLQALWAGYYVEPRMVIDVQKGLFLGLRGQGYMLGQYLAKMYVDKLTGKAVPQYFNRLALQGDGLLEKAFK
ncbi:MAG: FAD-dependent oxidoreductase [Bacteroidales bacterium]|nr:FAD-dependent oxidoreductase [Bacteroidales bacterium]MCF8332539.1 FAD-dependent oxidoreductase [Bacteroidales bacterium]